MVSKRSNSLTKIQHPYKHMPWARWNVLLIIKRTRQIFRHYFVCNVTEGYPYTAWAVYNRIQLRDDLQRNKHDETTSLTLTKPFSESDGFFFENDHFKTFGDLGFQRRRPSFTIVYNYNMMWEIYFCFHVLSAIYTFHTRPLIFITLKFSGTRYIPCLKRKYSVCNSLRDNYIVYWHDGKWAKAALWPFYSSHEFGNVWLFVYLAKSKWYNIVRSMYL